MGPLDSGVYHDSGEEDDLSKSDDGMAFKW